MKELKAYEKLKEYVDGVYNDIIDLYNNMSTCIEFTETECQRREEAGEPLDLFSYLEDVVDIEYRIGQDGYLSEAFVLPLR